MYVENAIQTLFIAKKLTQSTFTYFKHQNKLISFGKYKKGHQPYRQEVVTLGHFLDRSSKRVKRWAKRSIKENYSEKLQQCFTDFCSVKTKANVKYFAGCWGKCNVHERDLICPECKYWIWHKRCLKKRFIDYSLDIPDFTSKSWMCINYALKPKHFKINV